MQEKVLSYITSLSLHTDSLFYMIRVNHIKAKKWGPNAVLPWKMQRRVLNVYLTWNTVCSRRQPGCHIASSLRVLLRTSGHKLQHHLRTPAATPIIISTTSMFSSEDNLSPSKEQGRWFHSRAILVAES